MFLIILKLLKINDLLQQARSVEGIIVQEISVTTYNGDSVEDVVNNLKSLYYSATDN